MLPSGAIVDIAEIDPLVISVSTKTMGFPAFSVMTQSGERASSKPDTMDEVLWKGVHERLFLYESDAEKFVLETNNVYDMIFIDAYDGDDIFPHTLWDPSSPFLKSLGDRLHPEHGTVVVNLHADFSLVKPDGTVPSIFENVSPMGKYVSAVGRAYKNALGGASSCKDEDSGLGFTVSAPWVNNASLVVCRGFGMNGGHCNKEIILNTLLSKSIEVEHVLNLPFPCVQYIKRGFLLVD